MTRTTELIGESGGEQPFDDDVVVDRFLQHYETSRGLIRTTIVREHLGGVVDLEAANLMIADIGCGDARDACWLAEMGHNVVAVDSAPPMLRHAEQMIQARRLTASVHLMAGTVDDVQSKFGSNFDLVLSHGVLMYQSDPSLFLRRHAELLREAGHLSVLTKNADALAFRAYQDGDVSLARRLLDDSQSTGHLGVPTSAHTLQQVADIAADMGSIVASWRGVRIFSDETTELADPEEVLELERTASQRDPYRQAGALLHVVLRKGIDLSALPEP